MTSEEREEREAHIRAVVDSAPLPPPEDITRLRALMRLDVRAATGLSSGVPQQITAATAA